MSPQKTKLLLPLIQAFAEGKAIQVISRNGEWIDVDEPTWGESPHSYRAKPEPPPVEYVPLEACDVPPGSVIRRIG